MNTALLYNSLLLYSITTSDFCLMQYELGYIIRVR